MQKLFKNYIEDGNNNGLYLLPFPTGFGKSYESVQYIANNYEKLKDNQHIFFITSNLNNLPIADMEAALGKEKMATNCIIVRSYRDYILENFNIEDIPEEFVNDTVNKIHNGIQNFKKTKSQYEDESDKENFIIRAPEIVNREAEKLDELEKTFRSYLYNIVVKNIREPLPKEDENGEKYSRSYIQEKVYESLKYDGKYQWIGKIYPNVYIKDYKIIFMSMKKFLTSNNPFYEPRYSFIDGDISNEAIIFIDEFDATKNTVNSHIIEQSIQNASDYIALVEKICNRIINYKNYLPQIIKNVIKEQHQEDFDYIQDEAVRIREEFKIYLKYHCNDVDGRNFLFNDSTYHTILNSSDKGYVYIKENKDENNMTIYLTDHYVDEDGTLSLYTVIRNMNRFLLSFKEFAVSAAKTYHIFKCNSRNKESDVLTEENALLSFYEVFGLTFEESLFLKNGYNYRSGQKRRKVDIAIKKNTFYDKGIRSYEFTNQDNRSESTTFSVIDISDTAEAIIANIASKAKVIGISATANIDSVLCNYSLNYLSKTLGDDFHTICEEDLNYIRELYNKQNKKYFSKTNPTGKIKPLIYNVNDLIENDGKDLSKKISTIFKDPKNIRKVKKRFNVQSSVSEYVVNRYLSISYVFRDFVLNSDIKSLLCLNNALPKPGSKLDPNILAELFEMIIKENDVKINKDYFVVLRSGNSFDFDKKRILERLSKGEKIFLMSAYATLGAGQNLPYSPAEDDVLINLNDEININDPRNRKKDIDAIYLGEITNVVTNLYSENEQFTSEDLYRYIFEVENLYENDEISYWQLNEAITNAFNKLRNSSKRFNTIPSGKIPYKSKTGYISKQVIQAIGRLNRTFNKRSKIPIYISSSIFENFDTNIPNKEIVSPEIEALIEYINERRNELQYNEENYQAERIAYKSKNYLRELLSNHWTWEKIELWKRLREIVLKHPTASKGQFKKENIISEYYICNDKKDKFNQYYFHESQDFAYVSIMFDNTKEKAVIRLKNKSEKIDTGFIKDCSFETSRLENILEYPGLRDYFMKNQYATTFKMNDYMMSPILFQNIYKGALGEVAGKFILERELNVDLSELEDENFEMFDYRLGNDIYIDFKHWRLSPVDKTDYLKKVSQKLKVVGGKRAYIINLIDDNEEEHLITKSYNGEIVEIPYLLNKNSWTADREVIELLREELLNEEEQSSLY